VHANVEVGAGRVDRTLPENDSTAGAGVAQPRCGLLAHLAVIPFGRSRIDGLRVASRRAPIDQVGACASVDLTRPTGVGRWRVRGRHVLIRRRHLGADVGRRRGGRGTPASDAFDDGAQKERDHRSVSPIRDGASHCGRRPTRSLPEGRATKDGDSKYHWISRVAAATTLQSAVPRDGSRRVTGSFRTVGAFPTLRLLGA
jgi:hypothetical protein